MTNSSPVVSNTTFEMVSSGSSSTGSSTGLSTGNGSTGGMSTGYSNAIGFYYHPGYYPNYIPWNNYYNYCYTCSKCGALVYGYHNCNPPVTVISYPVYIPNPVDIKALEERLNELTEEIKRLRKQQKKLAKE